MFLENKMGAAEGSISYILRRKKLNDKLKSS